MKYATAITSLVLVGCSVGAAPTQSYNDLLLPSERSEPSGGTATASAETLRERNPRDVNGMDLTDSAYPGAGTPSTKRCYIESIVGHCITNAGTACIEYHSGDANVLKEECGKTGMPTGWFVGACGDEGVVFLALSNGGCYDGDLCLTRFSFPLGGKPATDATRLDYKSACISFGMSYVSAQ